MQHTIANEIAFRKNCEHFALMEQIDTMTNNGCTGLGGIDLKAPQSSQEPALNSFHFIGSHHNSRTSTRDIWPNCIGNQQCIPSRPMSGGENYSTCVGSIFFASDFNLAKEARKNDISTEGINNFGQPRHNSRLDRLTGLERRIVRFRLGEFGASHSS